MQKATKQYTPTQLSDEGIIPLHRNTILDLIRKGELKATNIARGNRRIYTVSQEAVDEWYAAKSN